MGLKIIGIGKKLPERAVSNDELASFLNTSDEWITSKTGISSRFLCVTESLTDLAEGAARAALGNAGLRADDVDMLICSTVSGDMVTPSLACCLLERLGIRCPAFDLSAACSGFIYALDLADAYIRAEKAKTVLIVSAEMMSRYVDWKDRATCVLFGDGSGACVAVKGDALKYIRLGADGNHHPLFIPAQSGNNPFQPADGPPAGDRPPGGNRGVLYMQGQAVFKFAVKAIEAEIRLALDTLHMKAEDVKYFLLHQANKRIIDGARGRLGFAPEKFPTNIERTGNISSASIPVLLTELLGGGRIQRGDTLLLTGFGAGMTTGTCVLVWE